MLQLVGSHFFFPFLWTFSPSKWPQKWFWNEIKLLPKSYKLDPLRRFTKNIKNSVQKAMNLTSPPPRTSNNSDFHFTVVDFSISPCHQKPLKNFSQGAHFGSMLASKIQKIASKGRPKMHWKSTSNKHRKFLQNEVQRGGLNKIRPKIQEIPFGLPQGAQGHPQGAQGAPQDRKTIPKASQSEAPDSKKHSKMSTRTPTIYRKVNGKSNRIESIHRT